MGEDIGRREFEVDQVERQLAAQAHQKEREVLFANEAFLIGVLQVVTGGSFLPVFRRLTRCSDSPAMLRFLRSSH